MRLTFLASNRGSAMQAICDAIRDGELRAEPVLVVSNNASSEALSFAHSRRLPSEFIPTRPDPHQADARLRQALVEAGTDLVMLSGYLRKVGPATLGCFAGRILNTHPALLPKFGGPGMYGRRVHEAVRQAGEAETGATIHLVDGEYDQGPVVAQKVVRIADTQDVDMIEQRVQDVEKRLLIETLARLEAGTLTL